MSIRITPFDEADSVYEIQFRLHPIDVGLNLKSTGMVIDTSEAPDPLRASCADRRGVRVVLEGPREEVLKKLKSYGYRLGRRTR